MQVKSPIADMHIDIKNIRIHRRYIVVNSDTNTSLNTTVYITQVDLWAFVRGFFTSALLFYMLTYPIQYILYKMGIGVHTCTHGNMANGDGKPHPTSHPW